MRIRKTIGILAFIILELVFTSHTQAKSLTLPSTLSLSGLLLSSPTTLTGLSDMKNKPLSIFFSKQLPLTISSEKKIEALSDLITLPSPTPTPKTDDKIPVIQQVFAAEITQTEITDTPTPALTQSDKTATSSANSTPAPVTATTNTSNGGLNADVIFGLINSYRQSQNLSLFQKNDQVCSLAASRAPEIANEIATGTMHVGMYGRHLSYWNTENIISMNSETAAVNWWIGDPIHHAAIVGPYTYSCVACSGNACAEEFTSLQPK